VTTTPEDLPDDIAALQVALVAERGKRIAEAARAARIEAELAVAKAKASGDQAVIAHQQLQIAKLTRQLYGQRSERTVQLLDQIELAFEELESSATEDEVAAEQAVAKTTNVVAFTRKRPARQPSPERVLAGRRQPAEPVHGSAGCFLYLECPDVCGTLDAAWVRLPDGRAASISICHQPGVCYKSGAYRPSRREPRSTRPAGRRILRIQIEALPEV